MIDNVRALLQDAFEHAPFEFWVRDLEGTCVVANAQTRRLGELLGRKVEDTQVAPDVLAAWQDNNRRAYAGEVVHNDFEHGDGDHKRYLQCYIVPLRINGRIEGLLGFNIDVSEQKRTEQALRTSERRLREALQVGRMGWLDWDLVTNEIRWSPETYRLFGRDPASGFVPTIEGTVGMVPAEDLAFVQERLEAAIAGTAPYDIIHRVVRPAGDVVHVHAQSTVMRDDGGHALRMLGTVVDVTERMRAELELREVDRRRAEFLGVLSHELRNPLAIIRSSVRYLDRSAIGGETARRAIQAIEHQTRHLARLVDDLLDVTRISSGKISVRRDLVDLVEIVSHTIEDHREMLAARELTTNLPATPAWVLGDRTRLVQVLGNLLSNAAKFTPAGGAVVVSVTVARGRAIVEVADTGIGIDDASLHELFVPFAQGDRSAEGSQAGLGLGLALVKKLVEMHGGEVHARSAGPGRGAAFTIALPIAAEQPAGPPRAPVVPGPPRRILVIEDDPDVAEWLALALALSGHQVSVALGGEEGLAVARTIDPEVILCDLGLPGALDGYAVARALQLEASLASTYRVALSGYAQPEDQLKAREAGFDAHIAKPPDLEALEELLARLPRPR